MNRKFRYPGQHDREEIERLHNRGATVAVIADRIGAHAATIYHELQKGYERDADGEQVIDAYGRRVYRAEIAQRTFKQNIKNCGKRTRRKRSILSEKSSTVWRRKGYNAR